MDWSGRVLRLRVEGPAHGGEFVARHEGRVVFCRGAITGELVDAVVVDDPGRAFCRASVTAVLEPSPDRVDPVCTAAAAGAGCCDWSHIEAGAARIFTGRIIAEQAERIGRIRLSTPAVPVEWPADDDAIRGWRTVARWVTGPDGRPAVRRHQSGELITAPCVQPDPRLTGAVTAAGVGPGREVLGVLGDDHTVHVAHRPAVARGRPPRGRSRRAAATRARARHAHAGAWEVVVGDGVVQRTVGERTWLLPVDAFWQPHRSGATHYSTVVREAVVGSRGLPSEPVVWDLYGGAGVFAAAVLDGLAAPRVTVVESSSASVGAAPTGLGGGSGVRTVTSRVESFLDGADGEPAPDVVILDPPRGGAGIAVMERLAAVTASRIIHVGCDPASLARDVGVLVAAGWALQRLEGVAAFPGTHHVEGIAVLDSPHRRR